jgi:hypothetical protein
MTAFPTSRRLAGLGLALAFATGGCGDTPAAPPAPITPIEPVSPPAAVRLAFARAYEPLEPGLPTTFTARAFDATGNVVAPRPGAMTYASSDPAVLREAALASNDTWTGTGGRPGRATLTARLGDLSVSTDIVVRDTTFVLANPGNTVLAGVPRRLLVSYRYLQDSPHVVTFSSASSTDPAVASVDIDGVVSGHTSGRASVSVAYHSQVFAGHVQVVANDTPLRFTQLRTIEGLTCALTGPGALYCWGGRIFEPAFQIDSSCYREFCQSRPTSFPIRTRADLAFGTLGEYMFAPCGLTEAGLVRCLVSAPADISALSLMTLEARGRHRLPRSPCDGTDKWRDHVAHDRARRWIAELLRASLRRRRDRQRLLLGKQHWQSSRHGWDRGALPGSATRSHRAALQHRVRS